MTATANYVAVDLGAASGRVMAGRWDGRRFAMEELHRFPNGGVQVGEHLYWNVLGIWSQIQIGLSQYRGRFPESPLGIGVDAWGVDFGLLDRFGRLLANPSHYRDRRTTGVPEKVFARVPEQRILAETGAHTMQINTLFQLYSMVEANDPLLAAGERLMMIPDLFTYFLSGDKIIEYTEATTTQMFSPARHDWARAMLDELGIPTRILPQPTRPGTVLSPVQGQLLKECGLQHSFPVIAVASHDTSSAVAAIPNMSEDSVFLSSGTWSLMGVELREPDTSERVLQLGFTNEGGADGSFLLLKNMTGLWIVQECVRQWKTEGSDYSWAALTARAGAVRAFQCLIDPDAEEFQAPCDMPAAIRRYCLDSNQPVPETVGEIARCAFESLSLKYRSVLDSLESVTGREFRTIRIVGGGCMNQLICQMIADACCRQVVSGPVEAGALGNVLLQAIARGQLADVHSGRSAIGESVQCSTFDPHPCSGWDEAYARFRRLEADGSNRAAAKTTAG
ncbi:MAG TPA: rhamnulokinase family protein [Acidisarcina sp.]|nr:rhamnulokinase family protein [Acidisarcina sp.]